MSSAPWVLLHSGALGDLVLAVQLLLRMPAVRRAGAIEVYSRADLGGLEDANPRIRRRSIEGLRTHWLFADDDAIPPEPLITALQGKRIVNFLAGAEASVHSRLLRLGPEQLISIESRPAADSQRHVVDQWQSQAERQRAEFGTCTRKRAELHSLGLPESLRQRGQELIQGAGCNAPPVLIHPGSGSPAKNWPLARYLEFVERLGHRRAGLPVLFLLGEVEQERWTADKRNRLQARAPVLFLQSAGELVAVLSTGRLLIGNDSGPSHLAALLGTPTLTLFGPTAPELWRPLGRQAEVLRGAEPEADGWGLTAEDVGGAAANGLRLPE